MEHSHARRGSRKDAKAQRASPQLALPIPIVFCGTMTTWPTIGILGGGQLARMTAYAAYRLGLRVHVLEKTAGSPAGQIAHKEVVGEPSDHRLLVEFARE